MRVWGMLFLLALWLGTACTASAAQGEKKARGVPVFLRGETLHGAEIYKKPAGVVVAMLPVTGGEGFERRNVTALTQYRDWVRIRYDGTEEGFVRTDDLAACTSLEQPVTLMNSSRETAKPMETVPAATPLFFVAVRGTWAQVEYQKGEQLWVRGWLPVQSLATQPAVCWKR